jgi:phosphoribosyl 1,2-cyclic phosphodiesterase
MAEVGVDPSSVQAICISHEHEDHVSGVGVMQRKRGVELFGNSATIEALNATSRHSGLSWSIFEAGQEFQIGALKIEPFSVPHDAYDPVGFRISCEGSKLGIVTDMGIATSLIRERLKDCDALVVEANHDSEMLKLSERPWSLKQRISGRHGHLSNSQTCELLTEVASPSLKAVYLAHISSDCNERDIAEKAVRAALDGMGLNQVEVEMTYASRPARAFDL